MCISVNDEHVLREWFREHQVTHIARRTAAAAASCADTTALLQALHSVSFVADWDAQVSTELGAAQHHSSARLGMRCRRCGSSWRPVHRSLRQLTCRRACRFAAVVANGIVAAVVPASDAMAPRAGCDLATLLLETL